MALWVSLAAPSWPQSGFTDASEFDRDSFQFSFRYFKTLQNVFTIISKSFQKSFQEDFKRISRGSQDSLEFQVILKDSSGLSRVLNDSQPFQDVPRFFRLLKHFSEILRPEFLRILAGFFRMLETIHFYSTPHSTISQNSE